MQLLLPKISESGASISLSAELFGQEDIDRIYAVECAATPFPWREQLFRDSVEAGHNCYCIRASHFNSDTEVKAASTPHQQSEIVAFAIFTVVVDEASLLDIAVHPRYQGKGLGRSLLLIGLRQMLELGAKSCLLEVRESNLAAQELYYSVGFYEVGNRPEYYPGKVKYGKAKRDKVGSAHIGAGRENALVLCMPLSAEALE